MKEKELPFGSQFSPNVVDLKEIMMLVDKARGKNLNMRYMKNFMMERRRH